MLLQEQVDALQWSRVLRIPLKQHSIWCSGELHEEAPAVVRERAAPYVFQVAARALEH